MINRFSPKPETSEKLKARQYGAATLLCVLVSVTMIVIRLKTVVAYQNYWKSGISRCFALL